MGSCKMSFLSAVSNILHQSQGTKSTTTSFTQMVKNMWKSPNRDLQSAAAVDSGAKYEAVETEDREFDHLHERDLDNLFDNLKLELLDVDDEEDDEEDDEKDEVDDWSGNGSFAKLKDLSDSLAEARLDFVIKSSDCSSLSLNSLSLTSSVTSESLTDTDSDVLWSADDDVS